MKRISKGDSQATATATASEWTKLEGLVKENPQPPAERVCAEIAKILQVQHTEVALLRLEKDLLKFAFPAELCAAGSIPLSSSAVAARTAVTKTSLLSNNFMKVKHASLFETVKLSNAEGAEPVESGVIQKLMSVPILNQDELHGTGRCRRP